MLTPAAGIIMGIILICTCRRCLVLTRPLPKGSQRGAADVSDWPWSLQRTDGEELTQVRGQRSWISVSGFRGDRIFYRQALLACAGDRWHHIAFEYPSNVKGSMTDFIRRAGRALEATQNAGCDIPVSSAE